MKSVEIVLVTILAAILFGILLDQVTARICLEFFTVGHRLLWETESPTLLGLAWGIRGTWWGGLFVGTALALSARAGAGGYLLARSGVIDLPGSIGAHVPAGRHAAFLADAWAHSAAYTAGFGGGTILSAHTYWRRRRPVPEC